MRNRCRIINITVMLWMAVVTAPAQAAFQDLESIRRAAHDFIAAETVNEQITPRIDVGRLDARLRLAACTSQLDAFLPGAGRIGGNTIVGVRCEGSQPWTVFVQSKVLLTRNVVVAARALSPGTVVTAQDIRLEPREVSRLRRGFLESSSEIIGKEVARTLSPGSVVTVNAVVAPKMIRRGEQVKVILQAGAVLVRSNALALSDGVKNQRIRVKNLSSRRIVFARVIGPGRVLVKL